MLVHRKALVSAVHPVARVLGPLHLLVRAGREGDHISLPFIHRFCVTESRQEGKCRSSEVRGFSLQWFCYLGRLF